MIIAPRRADRPAAIDGRRLVVDRVWPRGVARGDLGAGVWRKEQIERRLAG